MLEIDNIGTWDENKKAIIESCKDTKEIKKIVTTIQIDLAGFKGRVIGTVVGVSAGISLLVTILTLVFGQSGIFR